MGGEAVWRVWGGSLGVWESYLEDMGGCLMGVVGYL